MNWQRLRIALLLLGFGGLYLIARQSGFLDDLDPQQLRLTVQRWGVYGVLVYLLLFSLGLLLYIPGTLFIVTAGLAWGPEWGTLIAYLGTNIAIGFSFVVVRFVGGTPFETHDHPLIEKLLKTLHARPVTNIAIMRLLMSTNAGLNYLMALSAVTFRQHTLGTLLGTPIPVALAVYFTEWFMRQVF